MEAVLCSELRDIPCLEFEYITPKKNIVASRSFGEKVTEKTDVLEAIATHASRTGQKLRAQGSVCGALQVFIRSSRFNSEEPHYANAATIAFPVATADTRNLIAAATSGVEQIFQPGIRYAKAGVMLLDISSTQACQQSLFTSGDDAKAERLMATLDQLNATFGKKTVFFAREGIQQPWAMKQQHRTAYTGYGNEPDEMLLSTQSNP